MNEVLPAFWSERVDRLMLGIEPRDALGGGRIALPIAVALDGIPAFPDARSAARLARGGAAAWDDLFGLPDAIGGLQPITRHDSCRHALLYRPGMTGPVAIRLFDRRRRYVPRRISYPLPADIGVASPRVRLPALFPGAAYISGDSATGMRGRVTWNKPATGEVPVRWARVEATINGVPVGHAHGDDRGEFLLLLDGQAGGLGDLASPITATVTVYAPAAPPAQVPGDPLGDLPLEKLLADPDVISPGLTRPPGYASTPQSSRPVDFPLGQLLTRQPKFFLHP